ncbi:unnamed protein product [Sphagnum balticum]
MQRCWSLYNKYEKLRIDDLRMDQVRTILLAISLNKMSDWFACQEGDLRWQNIKDIPDFYEDTRAHKGELPNERAVPASHAAEALPPAANAALQEVRRPLFEEAPQENNLTSTLAMEAENTRERRSARRYVRNLRLQIERATGVHEFATTDVSMTGLGLKEALPADVPKQFRAQLVCNGQTLRVICQRISAQQVRLTDAEAWDVLRNWIINW